MILIRSAFRKSSHHQLVGAALILLLHKLHSINEKKPIAIDLFQDNNHQPEAPSDSETIDANDEMIDMKRRLTLVTAEEPIPFNEDDLIEHPPVIEDVPILDGSCY